MKKFLLSLTLLGAGFLFSSPEIKAQSPASVTVANEEGVPFTYLITDPVNKIAALDDVAAYTVPVLHVPGTFTHNGNTYVVRSVTRNAFASGGRGTIVFSDSIRTLEGRLWYSPVDSIKFPAQLERIANPYDWNQTTFACGLNVPSYTFPSTLKDIGGYCFAREFGFLKNLYGLEHTQVDTLQNAFYLLQGLESISLPKTLRGASREFLNGMTKLKEIVLPEGMRTLNSKGSGMLSKNPVLEKMTIPSTMKWMIIAYGIYDNPSLKRININATTPPVFTYQHSAWRPAPFGAHADLKLYVPIDCSKAYMTSSYEGWSAADNQSRYREEAPMAASGYRSFYLENENFEVPAGYTAYVVTGATKPAGWVLGDPYNADIVSYPAGTILPAKTACILWSGSAGAKTMTYKANVAGTEATVGTNLLVGTARDTVLTPGAGERLYVFSGAGNGTLGAGFYTQAGRNGGTISVGAHKAGLRLPASAAPARGLVLDFSQAVPYQTTGITQTKLENKSAENAVYDLSGRRVKRAQKGVYIENGKKVIR